MDCSGTRAQNLAQAEQMIREAAQKKAQIILLPEVFHELFFITDLNSKYFDAAEPIPGPITDMMQKLAAELGVVIVAPIYESVGRSVYYNSAAVIDADGKLLGVYRKNHIPLNTIFYEKLYFKPGNLGYPVFGTRFGKVGGRCARPCAQRCRNHACAERDAGQEFVTQSVGKGTLRPRDL
jgi:N-carbamoylputrescine amidase